MAVTDIDQVLLNQAQQEAQGLPSLQNAILLGSTLGAGIGATAGQVPHSVGVNINKVKDRLAEGRGMTRKGMPMKNLLKLFIQICALQQLALKPMLIT